MYLFFRPEIIRFKKTFSRLEKPILHAETTDSKFKYDGTAFQLSCLDFTAGTVKSDEVEAAEVTFIAGLYVNNSLHGPASLLKTRTIIKYQCRLG